MIGVLICNGHDSKQLIPSSDWYVACIKEAQRTMSLYPRTVHQIQQVDCSCYDRNNLLPSVSHQMTERCTEPAATSMPTIVSNDVCA